MQLPALASLLFIAASACATGGASNFVPPSRPAQFSMAGIPWGISTDSATTLIEPRGYNFNRVDEDGDLWFDGVLNRVPTRIFGFMADQKQLEAIRSGKATLKTYWLPAAGTRMSHVAVEVTDKLVVTVDYEGPSWDRESVRRRQQR